MTTTPLEIKTAELYTCVFSPDGKRALTGASNSPVKLWDTEAGKCLHTFDDSTVNAWCLGSTQSFGHAAIGGVDPLLQIWEIDARQRVRSCKGHTGLLRCADLTADLRLAISGSGYRDTDVRVWDLETGKGIHILKGHVDGVYDVALNADGRRALSGSRDTTVRVWDLETGKCTRVLDGHTYHVQCVGWSADEHHAISCSTDVRLWDLSKGECSRVFQGHSKTIRSVRWSADGRSLISASYDATVRVWNVETGECLRILKDDKIGFVNAVFTTDGSIVACDEKGVIHRWG